MGAADQTQQRPAAAQAELERTDRTLQELQEMKSQLTQLQSRVDALIQALSESRGALANAKPAPFGGVPVSDYPDSPDTKPKVGRCAALTKDGTRCSRPAVAGQRYCRQHQLARQK